MCLIDLIHTTKPLAGSKCKATCWVSLHSESMPGCSLNLPAKEILNGAGGISNESKAMNLARLDKGAIREQLIVQAGSFMV